MRLVLPLLGCVAGCQLVFGYDGETSIDAPLFIDPMDADAADAKLDIDARPPPPVARLVAHYTLDENVNNTFSDESGNDHIARCTACPTSGVPGRVGGAMVFDGTHVLTVDSSMDFDSPLGFTISFWVDVSQMANGSRCIVGKPFGPASQSSWAGCISGFVPFHATTNEGMFGSTAGSSMLTLFGYDHIVLRWTGAKREIFVNGLLAGSAEVPGPVAFDDHPIVIGADLNAGVPDSFFMGAIDEVKIFDGIVSEQEIQALFQTP